LQKVSKAWGAVIGVDAIDLEIKDKEFMVLLGPSGCGKTTTMRMIAGLEMPTGGDIYIAGQRMTDVDARDRDAASLFDGRTTFQSRCQIALVDARAAQTRSKAIADTYGLCDA
jgi:ABC-type sugar transport system ATPase subunit